MRDQILSYNQMCSQENTSLQRGMNFRLNPNYSVLLMSQRKNAPYQDEIYDDGITIEYEGHDVNKSDAEFPKLVNQQLKSKKGTLTQNGKFAKAIDNYKSNNEEPEIVRIYEKLFDGTWSDKGFFIIISRF